MRILAFRLSSLGDLLISTAFLENLPEGVQVDWVVASDFAFVLQDHPRIRRLWVFDRKSGMLGWLRLVARLHREDYDLQVDLHRTIRTRIAFAWFFFAGLLTGRKSRRRFLSKERFRTLFLFLLKRNLPRSWRPAPYWRRFAMLAGGGGEGDLRKPSFLPCLEKVIPEEASILESYRLVAGGYYAVMPSSRWSAKEWGAGKFFELVVSLGEQGLIPLLLGREGDAASCDLRRMLKERGIGFRDALGEADFRKTALLLRSARFYVGCDTGMSHLAEAVGCPAVVIFGPTRPELGFGPCRPSSRSVSIPLSCAPCSKDGRFCFRLGSPNQCMKGLPVDLALKAINEVSGS